MRIRAAWMVLPVALASATAGFGQNPAEKVFVEKCATCHGADGSGQTALGKRMKVRNLRSAETQKMSDATLFELIAKGKGDMSGYQKELGDEQIKALVAHIRSLSKTAK